jgi:hypothetical protein
MDSRAPLEPQYRRAYILGGDAIFTLQNPKTGVRFTYRVKGKEAEGDKGTLYFVQLLAGPNNREDYKFLGTIFPDGRYRHGSKSPIRPDAPSAKAFAWIWEHMENPNVEVWHEGKCSRCGRALTDPESIQRGLGPICAER